MTPLRVGTRGSELALWQAHAVADRIRAHSGHECELKIIKTTGDRLVHANLSTVGGKRVFVKEIEQALVSNEIDLAVHSAKDMPAELPDGLVVRAVLPREDPRDAVVLPPGTPLSGLNATEFVTALSTPPRVGSGSVRRVAQLSHVWPDAQFQLVRGNVGTRLGKLDAGGYDLLILAAAGLKRLGFTERISATIDTHTCVPAPGQGVVAIEARSDDQKISTILHTVNDPITWAALSAERAVVTALGGGCQVPIGALAEAKGDELHLSAIVASLDGTQLLRRKANTPGHTSAADLVESAAELGNAVARGLLEDGAGPILDAARQVDTSAVNDET